MGFNRLSRQNARTGGQGKKRDRNPKKSGEAERKKNYT